MKLKPTTSHRSAGFTLLEMMVVLLLVSLISVLLMQGFSYVIGIQERLRNQLVKIQNTELKEHWFRLVTRSFHYSRNADGADFKGSPTELSGLVLQPLNGMPGVPTKVKWSLQEDGDQTILYYQQAAEPAVPIIQWREVQPEFRYLNTNGDFVSNWPQDEDDASLLFNFAGPTAQPLPKGVVIMDTSQTSQFFWYVSITSNAIKEPDFAL